MKGRFLPYAAAAGIPASLPVNHDMRTKIRGRKFGDTKYEKMLLTLIALGLPKSIHEGFSLNRANIRRKCLNPPRGMVSAVGWDFIETVQGVRGSIDGKRLHAVGGTAWRRLWHAGIYFLGRM